MSFRIDQINSIIKNELGRIIITELGKSASLITITAVDTSKDLGYAKVWVSIFGEAKETFDWLNTHVPRLQKLLYERIHYHRSPKLVFKLDQTAERVERISRILNNPPAGMEGE